MVKRLESFTRAGANLNQTNSVGITAIHAAALNHQDKVVRYLIEKNVDIQAKDRLGRTAYELALFMQNKPVMAMLKTDETM